MSEQAPKPNFVKTALSQQSLRLEGPKWSDASWNKPALEVELTANNPRFTVWLSHPSEAEKVNRFGKPLSKTPVGAHMHLKVLKMILSKMRSYANDPSPNRMRISNFGPAYDDNGERIQGKKEVKSKTEFGRNVDGVMYITVWTKDRPKPMFEFASTEWVLIEENDKELDKVQDSNLACLAWVDSINDLLAPVANTNFAVPPPREYPGKPQGNKQPAGKPSGGDAW